MSSPSQRETPFGSVDRATSSYCRRWRTSAMALAGLASPTSPSTWAPSFRRMSRPNSRRLRANSRSFSAVPGSTPLLGCHLASLTLAIPCTNRAPAPWSRGVAGTSRVNWQSSSFAIRSRTNADTSPLASVLLATNSSRTMMNSFVDGFPHASGEQRLVCATAELAAIKVLGCSRWRRCLQRYETRAARESWSGHLAELQGLAENHRTHLLCGSELVDDLPVLQTRNRRCPEAEGFAGGRDVPMTPLVRGSPGEHDHDPALGGQHLVGGHLDVGERGADLSQPLIVLGKSATPDVLEELQEHCPVLFRRHVDVPFRRHVDPPFFVQPDCQVRCTQPGVHAYARASANPPNGVDSLGGSPMSPS